MTTQILMLDSNEVKRNCRVLGSLQCSTTENKKQSLPLNAVSVSARVVERLAYVSIKETFKNPHKEHLEAVYIFPLSGGCAVSSFEMKVGDRVIVGKVAERQEAREQYSQAMQEGKRAALMEQERDDVFTVQVGNLPPGEEVTVQITYSEKLPYFDNGTTEIRLPLVVAPRYIAGEPVERDSVGDGTELDTHVVPDASRITPPRLAPGVDPKIALKLSVELAGEQIIEDLSCSQHATKVGTSKDGVKVSLSREDELLDRDFVLRWRVTTGELQSNLIVFKPAKDSADGYAMLSLLPPKTDELASPPRDVIFIIDRSGSMGGLKMVSAARACSLLLATLGPKDRFAIQAFDDSSDWFEMNKSRFVSADEAGREAGDKFLRGVTARGGTEMFGAFREALDAMTARKDKKRRLPVMIILTDGEVGNEGHILKYVQQNLTDSRLFSVGIDTAVNSGFLTRIAAVGGGTSTFVEPGAQLEDALACVGREIGAPLVTDIQVDDVNLGLDKKSIAPLKLSDLFEGRATTAFFKFDAGAKADLQKLKIRVNGKHVDGSSFSEEVSARVVDMPAMSQLWAKAPIVDLEDRYRISEHNEQEKLHKQMVELAVDHSLLTRFTAFVVVDHAEIVNAGGDVRKVVQPVQMPSKWLQDDMALHAAPMRMRRMGAGTFGGGAPAGGGWGAAPASGMWGSSSYGASPSGAQYPSAPAPQASPISSSGPGQSSSTSPSPASSPASSPAPSPASSFAPSPASSSASSGFIEPAPSAEGAAPAAEKFGMGGGDSSQSDAPTVAESIRRKLSFLNLNNIGSAKAPPLDETQTQLSQAPVPPPPLERTHTEGSDSAADGSQSSDLGKAWFDFEVVMRKVFESIRSGMKPGVDDLEAARIELLRVLAVSQLATKLPLMQKYLRSEVVRLITAIESATAVTDALKKVASDHEQWFEAVTNEAPAPGVKRKPFWRNI